MAFLTSSNVLFYRERKEDRDRHKGRSEVSALVGRIKRKFSQVYAYIQCIHVCKVNFWSLFIEGTIPIVIDLLAA